MRTPAPLLLVTVPGGWLIRRHRTKRAVTREATEREARFDKQLERRGILPATDAAEETSESPTTRRARVSGYHHQRSLMPLPVGAGLAVVWVWLHLVPSGWSWPSIASAAVPLAGLAAAGWWWIRQVAERYRPAASATVAAGLVWVVGPAALPIPVWPHTLNVVPDLPWWWAWPLLLTAGTGIAVAARYWRFRIREHAAPPEVSTPEAIWDAELGAEGALLAGTFLTDVHRVISQTGEDVGWQGTIVGQLGKHNVTKIKARKEDIVGAYGRDLIDGTIERTGNALRAHLSIMERDPFPEVVEAKIGMSDDGLFTIGPYFDSVDAQMRAWTPAAGSHDFWGFGVKGSGKSTLVENALGSLTRRGLVTLHLTDLKGGMSLPQWRDVAYRYGKTAADGLMQLRRLDGIGAARMAAAEQMRWYAPGDSVVRVGRSVLEPSLEWTIHLGVIEEAPQLWKIKEAVEIAERITTMYRAVLVSLFPISQMCELQQAWGGSSTLRTQIQGGNVWCGYVPKDQANLGFDHFHPDLSLIKKNSYHSYVTSPVMSREALLRVARVKDSWALARSAEPGVPNPVDVAAVQEVEARYGLQSGVETQERPSPDGITRGAVADAVKRLSDAAGQPTTMGAIAAALGNKDDVQHYDRVKYLLKQLVEDPSSPVTKPAFGKYAA